MTFGSLARIAHGLLIEPTRTWKIKLIDDSFDNRCRWMSKPVMPSCEKRFEDTKDKLERLH
jgi:hypothetical protein